MDLRPYIDATYLKTPERTFLDDHQMRTQIQEFVKEAIRESYRAVMILPSYVPMARWLIDSAGSKVYLGTVISFPEGSDSLEEKLSQIKKSLKQGADELDVVMNYKAYKEGDLSLAEREIIECSAQALKMGKTIKWIIETAALDAGQIVKVCKMIRQIVLDKMGLSNAERVYVKSSTGFFPVPQGACCGANVEDIKSMCEASAPLPVKASGGILNADFARALIKAGAQRLGTSSPKNLIQKI